MSIQELRAAVKAAIPGRAQEDARRRLEDVLHKAWLAANPAPTAPHFNDPGGADEDQYRDALQHRAEWRQDQAARLRAMEA